MVLNEKRNHLFWLLLFFVCIAVVSFYRVEQSLSPVKYIFSWRIQSLLENYALYKNSFWEFLYRTSAYHTGDAVSSWETSFFLLPLFLFCDFLGGLSFKNMYLFTITITLIFLGFFYWWMKGVFGRQAALYGAFFLGSSSVFQEVARTGSYLPYSLLVGIIWLIFFSHCLKSNQARDYALLGILTGILWYGYGTLRYLTIIPIIYILFVKKFYKIKMIILFLSGFFLLTGIGFYINVQVRSIDLAGYKKPVYQLFFDQEASFYRKNPKKFISDNFKNFKGHLLGERFPNYTPIGKNADNAALLNPFLFLAWLLGVVRAIQRRSWIHYKILLVLALIVYFMPLVCVDRINSLRRILIYIIPTYCFIGLGVKQIQDWLKLQPDQHLKKFSNFVFIIILLMVLIAEGRFIFKEILSSKRDIGLLKFAHKIEKLSGSARMHYLEGDSLFRAVREENVLRLALIKHGRSPFHIVREGIKKTARVPSGNSYLARSPGISNQDFDDWCAQNNLKVSLLIQIPVENVDSAKGKQFRLYQVFKE